MSCTPGRSAGAGGACELSSNCRPNCDRDEYHQAMAAVGHVTKDCPHANHSADPTDVRPGNDESNKASAASAHRPVAIRRAQRHPEEPAESTSRDATKTWDDTTPRWLGAPVPERDYRMSVGKLAHRTVAEVAGGDLSRSTRETVAECWPVVIRLAPAGSLGARTRAARITAASLAAVYVRFFLPPPGWTLTAVEAQLADDGRVDLVWVSSEGTVVFDELKLAGTSGRSGGDGPDRRQAARYSAYGSRIHGERFGGVRLVMLGAPRHSMLVGPGARLCRLSDSPLWFERGDADREAQR
jgi:hypothetical protein